VGTVVGEARQTLLHDQRYPSRLVVPIIPR